MPITNSNVHDLFEYRDGELWWKEPKKGRDLTKPAGAVSSHGYRVFGIKGRQFRLHRVVWLYHYGKWPKGHIDHIDGNKLNNNIDNLREASIKQNSYNQGKRKNNTSGYKGVTWHKGHQKWYASIKINGNSKYLGSFSCPKEAHDAYCEAAKIYHGEFMNVGD